MIWPARHRKTRPPQEPCSASVLLERISRIVVLAAVLVVATIPIMMPVVSFLRVSVAAIAVACRDNRAASEQGSEQGKHEGRFRIFHLSSSLFAQLNTTGIAILLCKPRDLWRHFKYLSMLRLRASVRRRTYRWMCASAQNQSGISNRLCNLRMTRGGARERVGFDAFPALCCRKADDEP